MIEIKLTYEPPHASPSVQVQMMRDTMKGEEIDYLNAVVKMVRQVILTDRAMDVKQAPDHDPQADGR